jgi:nicotinamidase-related amidase
MQKESFPPEARCFDTDGVTNRINMLSGMFRKLNYPVIVIQHDGTEMNEYIPNTPGWEFLDELEVMPTDIIVSKTANDSFYKTSLQSLLADMDINELIITGSATDFCVDSTVQSALTKDYNIVVVKDGHTAGERPHLKAESVIAHYNWVWKNLTPTKGKIDVKSFEEIRDMLKASSVR